MQKISWDLTHPQKRIWHNEIIYPEKEMSNVGHVIRFKTTLEMDIMKKAFDILEKENKILSTVLRENVDSEFDIKCESIHEKFNNVFFLDLSGENAYDVIRSIHNKKMKLYDSFLFELYFIKYSSEEYGFYVKSHHIFSDGYSTYIFVNELMEIYNKLLRQEEITYIKEYNYIDFYNFEIEYLSSEKASIDRDYWLERLQDFTLNTSFSSTKSANNSLRTKEKKYKFKSELATKTNEMLKLHNLSLFQILVAILAIYNFKINNKTQCILGIPVHNRSSRMHKGIIGMFASTLPFAFEIDAELSFIDLLKEIKSSLKQDMKHQKYPFNCIVENLRNKNVAFENLINILVVESIEIDLDEIKETYALAPEYSQSELSFFIYPKKKSNDIELSIVYQVDLYSEKEIDTMFNRFEILLENCLERVEIKVGEVELLSDMEMHRILYEFNNTDALYPREKTIHQLFEEQVKNTPDSIAVVFNNSKLTYRELNEKSNKLARFLIEKGVRQDCIVGIMMERSIDFIVSIMGVLKSGGGILSIDPSYPKDRKEYIVNDSNTKLIITNNCLEFTYNNVELIKLSEINYEIYSSENLASIQSSESALYVIYTSGTTGNPKGLVLEHKNLVNLISSEFNNSEIDFVNSNISQFASMSFDVCYQEIFTSLLSGAKLVIVDKETKDDLFQFLNFLREKSINVLFLPTAYFKFISSNDSYFRELSESIKHIIVAGEQLIVSDKMKEYLKQKKINLHNHYGPSETHVATTLIMKPNDNIDDIPSIGKPIANTKIFILNENNKMNPIGVYGELCIGGDGVGRGYLGREELNYKKFVKDIFNKNEKIYKTGDIARWLQDGNIEFWGRMDHQVKIRGYRIELGEIEAKILSIDLIKEAVVTTIDKGSEKDICAYYVSNGAVTTLELRNSLETLLPNYMIPSYFIELEKIPITPNGKVDKKALPELEAIKNNKEYTKPKNDIERKLVKIWQEILELEHFGVNDNFFEIGGHSLKAISLITKIKKNMQVTLNISEIFQNNTIEKIAKLIEGDRHEDRLLDLKKEAIFDLAEKIKYDFEIKYTIENILLTGSTGFVGNFLLKKLLEKTNANVYCLIRGNSEEDALKRLIINMKEYDLWEDEYRSRIKPVLGDISKPFIGMDKKIYDKLCGEIDVIYHNGTYMNHLADYHMLKDANVKGIEEILKFATLIKNKKIHYTSTVGVFNDIRDRNNLIVSEDTNLEAEKHYTSQGYSGSKWVSEKILQKAIEKGVICNIYRLGLVLGDTKHGRYSEQQWFYQLIESCLILNKYFEEMELIKYPMIPVNLAAEWIVTLSLNSENDNNIFNILQKKSLAISTFFENYRKSNKEFERINFLKWRKLGNEYIKTGRQLPIYPYIQNMMTMSESEFEKIKNKFAQANIQFDNTKTLESLRRNNCDSAFEFNEELSLKYFEYIRSRIK